MKPKRLIEHLLRALDNDSHGRNTWFGQALGAKLPGDLFEAKGLGWYKLTHAGYLRAKGHSRKNG